MHCLILIFIQCLIVQDAVPREIWTDNSMHDFQRDQELVFKEWEGVYKDLMLFENQGRSISDVWSDIKNRAKTAWHSIKSLVDKTKEKIAIWAQHIKNRAEVIKENFAQKLKELKNKIRSIVEKIVENENVHNCIKDNIEDFDTIIREIINNVSLCISDKMNSISSLEDCQVKSMKNYTDFMAGIDKKLTQCMDSNNVDECLTNVRMDIIKETDAVADEVLEKRIESRGVADDILDAIITCSSDGLIQASAVVTTEAINVIQCVLELRKPGSDGTSENIIRNVGK